VKLRTLTPLALVLTTACATRHEPKPLKILAAPAVDGGPASVTVGAHALHPGVLRLKYSPLAILQVDAAVYAAALGAGVAAALRDRGRTVSDDAAAELEISFDHATIVPGAWRLACFVDVTVTTSSGYRHGFQGRGEDMKAEDACQQALSDTASRLLSDPGVNAFLVDEDGAADTPAAGDVESSHAPLSD
jgi:hypothetical protein